MAEQTERFSSIVRQIADTDEVISFHERNDRCVFFEVRTEQGRSQVVMAQLIDAGGGVQMVHMMSEIGPADPSLYEAMLVRNLSFCYARLALVEGDGGGYNFAVVYAYPLSELEVVEFARAFGEVAYMADGIERELYGGSDKT